MELTMRERKKFTMVKAQAYLRAGKAKKSAMLDDFCESTGYHRKYAARVLHQAGQRYLLGDCVLVADPTKHIHRHRPPRYGPLVQDALITIWSASTFLGPVRLAGGMSLFVENLTMHGHLSIDEETRRLLLQMSPATIGRLLATERHLYRLPWHLSYEEHSAGRQDPHPDLHGLSTGSARRLGCGPGRS